MEPLAVERHHRGYLFFDLLTGRLDTDHPLRPWLLRNGVTEAQLARRQAETVPIEVMGLNFYPQWSTKQLSLDAQGGWRLRNVEHRGPGFAALLRDFYERYRRPILITETSAKNSLAIKRRWLEQSVATTRTLRAAGVPVIGYTWFPLFSMIDWRYRKGKRPAEHYLIELGLYESRRAPDGTLRYVPTELVERFRALSRDPHAAVGDLKLSPGGDP